MKTDYEKFRNESWYHRWLLLKEELKLSISEWWWKHIRGNRHRLYGEYLMLCECCQQRNQREYAADGLCDVCAAHGLSYCPIRNTKCKRMAGEAIRLSGGYAFTCACEGK